MEIDEKELAELRRKVDILERTKEYFDNFYSEEAALRCDAAKWRKVEEIARYQRDDVRSCNGCPMDDDNIRCGYACVSAVTIVDVLSEVPHG